MNPELFFSHRQHRQCPVNLMHRLSCIFINKGLFFLQPLVETDWVCLDASCNILVNGRSRDPVLQLPWHCCMKYCTAVWDHRSMYYICIIQGEWLLYVLHFKPPATVMFYSNSCKKWAQISIYFFFSFFQEGYVVAFGNPQGYIMTQTSALFLRIEYFVKCRKKRANVKRVTFHSARDEDFFHNFLLLVM